ncbi:MAG TPA: NUDIX domain-containing protein [Tepidisphaeraceae bacterium]|nr:NUDIX domain-containing protein [Tepidisphaeraceae bacterium]
MPEISAGLLMYRRRPQGVQVLLVHPGGPFWQNKDAGVWSIPKGLVRPNEDLLAAAIREFTEEIGHEPRGPFIPLSPVKHRSGKIVHAWAVEGDLDTASVTSNTFQMEWPPRSGKRVAFPEIDRAEFFCLDEAHRRINPGQAPLLDELARLLHAS